MTPEQYARVKELFLQASALQPVERQAFLQRESAGDTELQAEVESLLAHHDSRTILQPRIESAANATAQLQTQQPAFARFLNELAYPHVEETTNAAYLRFLA